MTAGVLSAGRLVGTLAILLAFAACAAVAGVGLGAGEVDWSRALAGEGVDGAILWQSRVPRVVAGALLGGGLAAVGVVFQAMLRNPLADPYVLGVSGGAAVGGTLALAAVPVAVALRLPLVQICAFAGALATTALMWRLARGRRGASALVILLGGVVFNAFAGAVIMFVQSVVVARKAQAILFWLMGSLSVETLQLRELLVAAAVVAGATAFLFRDARALNALSMGDDGARRLGVDVDRLRRRLLVACCLVVGAAVSVGGMIGFVGLVVPHALRLLVGPDHRLLLPAAALGGAGFLVLCDLGARALFPVLTTELPVGVITAAVGCPLFLYLLWREREALA